ncbi:hypothetical protein AGLY_014981 [Aphis glycines]|uniref:Uncharacterized protein n=1 Tax=Aphis glycines TaxID=307491 RepID=A0A6G0T4U3_APHGL|nr:hypothetical protein AGLY_014981 [Aphis glycines]
MDFIKTKQLTETEINYLYISVSTMHIVVSEFLDLTIDGRALFHHYIMDMLIEYRLVQTGSCQTFAFADNIYKIISKRSLGIQPVLKTIYKTLYRFTILDISVVFVERWSTAEVRRTVQNLFKAVIFKYIKIACECQPFFRGHTVRLVKLYDANRNTLSHIIKWNTYDIHIKYKHKYFLNRIYNITIHFFFNVFITNDSVIKDKMKVD